MSKETNPRNKYGPVVDIRKVKLEAGNRIYYYNPSEEYGVLVDIADVVVIEETGVQKVLAKVIAAYGKRITPGTPINFVVNPNDPAPALATVFNTRYPFKGLTTSQSISYAIECLSSFLESKDSASATFADCLLFLSTLGWKESSSHKNKQEALSRICKTNSDRFRSVGGRIELTQVSHKHFEVPDNIPRITDIRTVDLSKLTQGITMILESGLFGEVVVIR